MKSDLATDSISNPKRKIGEIQTEYSQIVRVLAEPLPQPSDTTDANEKQVMVAAREQQLQERQRFILRYQIAIKAYLGKKLGNPTRVEDVWDFFLQKCLEGKLSKYDPKTGSFRHYLKRVLRNTCYEYARKNAKDDGLVQMDSVMGPAVEAKK